MTFDAYHASSAQKRLYFIDRLTGESVVYNMPGAWIIEGEFEPFKLENAMKRMIERHETLRTCFHQKEDMVLQKAYEEMNFSLPFSQQHGVPVEKLLEDFVRPFNLDELPLWRLELIGLEPGKQLLLFDIHHINSDGVSMNIIINELTAFYRGENPEPMEFQYVDFTTWQNDFFEGPELKKQEDYWRQAVAGDIPSLALEYDFPQQPGVPVGNDGAIESFQVSGELVAGIREQVVRGGSTLFAFLIAAYNVLLHRCTGNEDVLVGTPTVGRTHDEFANIIGMFVNTLVIRSKPVPGTAFSDFFRDVTTFVFRALENQDYQFEMLVEKVVRHRHNKRNPLFDVMFVLQNYSQMTGIAGSGFSVGGEQVNISSYPMKHTAAKFDITLSAYEATNQLVFQMEYFKNLFSRETILRMGDYFVRILEQVVADPDITIGDIDLLSSLEKQQLIVTLNDTEADYPREKTIHGLIEEQAAVSPDKNALLGEDEEGKSQSMTFRQLNVKGEYLAGKLRENGIGPQTIIAVMAAGSIDMMVAFLGIFKAGCAYLPMDPAYPANRSNYMLQDSGAVLLLHQGLLPEAIDFSGLKMSFDECLNQEAPLEVHGLGSSDGAGENTSLCRPDFPAYVIYTSGTTGRPKGVLVEHRSAVNTLWFRKKTYDFRENDVALQLFSSAFDGFVTSGFTPLVSGVPVVLPGSGTIKDMEKLKQLIISHRVTHFIAVPPLFRSLLSVLSQSEAESLRVVTLAGDTPGADLLETARSKNRNLEIVNEYGVTEASVLSTIHRHQEKTDVVSIGLPIANTAVYILNPRLRLQPIGVVGELFISGVGISRGYLNNPSLSAERFHPNPFTGVGNAGRGPLQRTEAVTSQPLKHTTGALARRLADGRIEFIGRLDLQVKIRGFRIELEEIEKQLLNNPGINEVVVIAKGDGENKYLCAYIVPTTAAGDIFSNPETLPAKLRDYLSQSLPGYMVPAYYTLMENIPLTPNGKVDKRALPEPQSMVSKYEAPVDNTEKTLVGIWSEILGVEPDKIGVNDDFFDLGGHSLRANNMVAKIHKVFDTRILLGDIFKMSSIRQLAGLISDSQKDVYASIQLAEEKEYYPVSLMQKRLYIVAEFEAGSTPYNLLNAVIIEGPLDRERLVSTFRELIRRHEALRTSFFLVDDQPVQKVHKTVNFQVEHLDIQTEGEIDRIAKEFIRPFKLSQAPLLRVGLTPLETDKYLLLMDIHHIVSDGTSMGILIRELTVIYDGKVDTLPNLRIQYKDFSLWQQGGRGKKVFNKKEAYWLDRFKKELPTADLFTDYPRPEVQSFAGETLVFQFDATMTQKIKQKIKETHTTLYIFLLTAYSILVSKYTGQEDVLVGTPVAGREHVDFAHLLGMFINTLVMRNFPTRKKSFAAFLEEVRESTLAAYENQEYPLDDLLEKIDIKRDLSRNPLFDVELVVQNMDREKIEMETLQLIPYNAESQQTQVDLALYANEIEEEIYFGLTYCSTIFKRETMEGFKDFFINIVTLALDNPDTLVRDFTIPDAPGAAGTGVLEDDDDDFGF
ncbi:MAG: amino acid adenylation domain-containing protein [bacterium]|nr:amino acid adenylation domain-containing protein [bacterium]